MATFSPGVTRGFWWMRVPWFERLNFSSEYSSLLEPLSITTRVASTKSTVPALSASTTSPVSIAARTSMPVPTSGGSVLRSGTAWRCMFEPISARLASSCSRNGISAVATDQIWFGDTSISSTSFGELRESSPSRERHSTWGPLSFPVLLSTCAFA